VAGDRQAPAEETRLLADRYRLGRLLGRGGSGVVYEALDITLGRAVAVKVFQADGNAVGRYRFAAEARLLANLSHPGLVTIHDVCLDDEPFLVMHLVSGPTIRDLLARGPFEPAAVARIGARLADVLAYLHAHDVVHRDIKPSNVLVDEDGDCHLTDFGVARALGATHLTASGELVGTVAYLAPEQVTDVDVGPGTDIYALGLLLLECLTGRTEYTGTTAEAAVARLNRPPRIPGTLPSPWHTLLTSMTARNPAARPTASRCADVLQAIAQGRTAVLEVTPAIPGPRRAGDLPRPGTAERHRTRLPRPRPVHAGLTALALAAACAVAAGTTTAIPGRPTGEPHRPAPSDSTRTVTETAPAPATTLPVPPAAELPGSAPPGSAPPAADAPATDSGDTPPKGNNGQKNRTKDHGNGKGRN
jgi:serine/threonine protein kinase